VRFIPTGNDAFDYEQSLGEHQMPERDPDQQRDEMREEDE
jgi:hypothetical protein